MFGSIIKTYRKCFLAGMIIPLLFTSCGPIHRVKDAPSAQEQTPTYGLPAATQTPEHLSSSIDDLTFVEKNVYYIELLEDLRASGKSIIEAEELYARSLEAMLNGENAKADQFLNQALEIMLD